MSKTLFGNTGVDTTTGTCVARFVQGVTVLAPDVPGAMSLVVALDAFVFARVALLANLLAALGLVQPLVCLFSLRNSSKCN